MSNPSPSDYQDAIQFPETAFADPELAASEPECGPLGLPRVITGAFAAVFPLKTPKGARVAVRCFLADAPSRRARSERVAHFITESGMPALVPFEAQPRGITVNGTCYPIVRMDWVEGTPLGTFVEVHRNDAAVLRVLAEAWRALLSDLTDAGFVHGDLQHGNVMVQENAGEIRLRLVDYDAATVPSLRGRPAPEVGHRNYQHPDRTEQHTGAFVDAFSGLVVYAGVMAVCHMPTLWDRFNTGENILFRSDDFFDPQGSVLINELLQHDALRPLAEALRTACYMEPKAVPSLEAMIAGQMPRALPRGRRRARSGDRAEYVRRKGFTRWAALLLGGAVAVSIGVAPASMTVGVALLFGLVGGWGLGAVRAYRSEAVVQRRRRLQREAAVLGRWVADLADERRRLAAERERAASGLEERRAERLKALQDEVLEGHLRKHFVGELDRVEGVGHRAVVRLKQAGIRDAFDATPERVALARGLPRDMQARIAAWRTQYVEAVRQDVPQQLSPAEERRLERHRERRLEAIDRKRGRLEKKKKAQQRERAYLLAQREAVPPVTLWAYVLFALRLAPLPEPKAPPPARPDQGEPLVPKRLPGRSPDAKPLAAASSGSRAWWEEAA